MIEDPLLLEHEVGITLGRIDGLYDDSNFTQPWLLVIKDELLRKFPNASVVRERSREFLNLEELYFPN